MQTIEVLVHAFEEINMSGALEILSRVGQLHAFTAGDGGPACPDVVVHVTEGIAGAETFDYLGEWPERCRDQAPPRCVLIAGGFRPEDSLLAVERGVFAFLRRQELSSALLIGAVLAVGRGAAVVPGSLQGTLLAQLTRLRQEVLEPQGFTLFGLEVRERAVLKLIADGLGTGEIATRLMCSESTVKNVLHRFMVRQGLNSRSHAVAHALRTGVI